MATITIEDGWKGSHWGQGKYENHESNLGEAEMKALALRIMDIPGMQNPAAQHAAQQFIDLSNTFKSKTGKIAVTKGIHQRDKKAHFNVQITWGSTPNCFKGVFEVFVVASATTTEVESPAIGWGNPSLMGKKVKRQLFTYVPSGLSCKNNSQVLLTFPPTFTVEQLEQPLGRPRSKSLCTGNSQALATEVEKQGLLGS